mgnify:CR=1 FL=1
MSNDPKHQNNGGKQNGNNGSGQQGGNKGNSGGNGSGKADWIGESVKQQEELNKAYEIRTKPPKK